MEERKAFTNYDLSFGITSLKELRAEGWRATKNQVKLQGAIVSVVGLFDKGKTFFLNRLAGVHLPCGVLEKTVGICVKIYHDENHSDSLLLVDSPGEGPPLQTMDADAIKDRRIVDKIVQEILIDISDYYVLVVNELTLSEQIALHHLVVRQKKEHPEQAILLVHNLRHVARADFEVYFATKIAPLYSTIPGETKGQQWESTRRDEDGVPIYFTNVYDHQLLHYFLVCEKTAQENVDEDGREFNDKTFGNLRKYFFLKRNFRPRDDLLDKLVNHAERLLPHYLQNKTPNTVLRLEKTVEDELVYKIPNAEDWHLHHFEVGLLLPQIPSARRTPCASFTRVWDNLDRMNTRPSCPDQLVLSINVPGLVDATAIVIDRLTDKVVRITMDLPQTRAEKLQQRCSPSVAHQRSFGLHELEVVLPFNTTLRQVEKTVHAGIATVIFFDTDHYNQTPLELLNEVREHKRLERYGWVLWICLPILLGILLWFIRV